MKYDATWLQQRHYTKFVLRLNTAEFWLFVSSVCGCIQMQRYMCIYIHTYFGTLGFVSLDANCSLRESVVWGSAAPTADGNIRLRAPGFPSRAFLYWCDPRAAFSGSRAWLLSRSSRSFGSRTIFRRKCSFYFPIYIWASLGDWS